MEGHVHHLPFFSPDFSQYLEVDRRQESFIVRDTLTNKIINHVPKELLSFNEKMKPVECINRF
jgi:hypothetical protein